MSEQEHRMGRPRKPRVNCPTCGQETMADKIRASGVSVDDPIMEIEDRAVLRELGKLLDLIVWLAPRIERRNGNGAVSDKLCLLCVLGQPQYKSQPCRHAEIWDIGRAV